MRTKYKFILLIIVACLLSIAIFYLCEKPNEVEKRELLISHQSKLDIEYAMKEEYTFDNPKVVLNPYEISPLTALIIFETKDRTILDIINNADQPGIKIYGYVKPGNENGYKIEVGVKGTIQENMTEDEKLDFLDRYFPEATIIRKLIGKEKNE